MRKNSIGSKKSNISHDFFHSYVQGRFHHHYRMVRETLLDLDCFLAELKLNGFEDMIPELCDKQELEKLSDKLDSVKAYFSQD